MPAPKGNQFWKIRSRHGRDKLFETPELLWEAACDYFEWCEKNPLKESQAKVVAIGKGEGSSVEIIELDKMRAMTLSGLCFYLHCNEAYFRQAKDRGEGFSTVIEEIQNVIYNQKFSGAAADLLNANIIARDLGLKDRTDFTTNDEPITGMVVK